MLLDIADHVLLGLHLVTDAVEEVRAVERRLEDRGIQNAEVLLDIALHLRRSRRGEGDDRRTPDFLDDVADPAVLGAEIVAPFGNAVRFVHGVEGNLHFAEQLDVLLLRQRFRCDVQEFRHAGKDVTPDLLDLCLPERGIQEMGDSRLLRHEAADHVHLVLHQGDQRGNDDGGSRQHECRELETE